MRGCRLADAAAELQLALDTLRKRREQIAGQWNDRTHARFEAKYVVPLEGLLARARDATRQMAETLRRAEAECGEES